MTEETVTLKEYMDMQLMLRDRALLVQHGEYLRRLEELNHEKDNLREMQTKYVLSITYDAKHDRIETDIRRLNTFKDRIAGQVALYPVVMFVMSIGVSLALHFWR